MTLDLVFGVRHYNPSGGSMDMKIIKPPSSSISVLMYGNVQNKDSKEMWIQRQ
jgi:hypothetical protein